jgi:hypothetical protein
MAAPAGLVGRWKVRVRHWTWLYDFDATNGVRWTDPMNGLTGKGTWKVMGPSLMRATYLSGTTEDWPLPLKQQGLVGACSMSEGGVMKKNVLNADFVPPDPSESVSYARIAPPVVSQGNARLCWAAALQSWLGATVNDHGEEQGVWSGEIAKRNKFDGLPWTRRVYSLQDMINLWGDQLQKDKSQTPEGIKILALDVGMDADLVMPSAFTTANITTRLQQKGDLYVVYFSRSSHHAVVVYGVGPDGIKVMDPLPTEGLKTRPHEFFREPQRANRKMLVGWAARGAPLGTDPQAPKPGPSGPTGPSAAQKLYYATILVPLWRGQLDEVGRLAREYRVHLLALECLRRAKGAGIDSVKVSEFCRKWEFPLATPFISPTALLKELLKKGIGLSGVGTVFDITGAIGKGVKIMAEMGPLLEKLQMQSALLFAFEDKVVPAADQTDVGQIIESSATPKALFDKAKTSKDRLEAKWREVTDQAEKMEAIRIEQGLPEERG